MAHAVDVSQVNFYDIACFDSPQKATASGTSRKMEIDSTVEVFFEVVQNLSWLVPEAGPIVGAYFTVIRAIFNRKDDDNVERPTITEKLIAALKEDFDTKIIKDAVSALDAFIVFKNRISSAMDAVHCKNMTQQEFINAVTQSGGYKEELRRISGIGSPSAFLHMICGLLDDDDLNTQLTDPYQDKQHWSRAYRKLITVQMAMTYLLKCHFLLVVLECISVNSPAAALSDMESDFKYLEPRIKKAAENVTHTRRAKMLKPVKKEDEIAVYQKYLTVADPLKEYNDKQLRTSPFMGYRLDRNIEEGFFAKTVVDKLYLVADQERTELFVEKNEWERSSKKLKGWSFEDAATGVTFRIIDDVLCADGLLEKLTSRKETVEALRERYERTALKPYTEKLYATFVEYNERWTQLVKKTKEKSKRRTLRSRLKWTRLAGYSNH